jgi:hypothetical protein
MNIRRFKCYIFEHDWIYNNGTEQKSTHRYCRNCLKKEHKTLEGLLNMSRVDMMEVIFDKYR